MKRKPIKAIMLARLLLTGPKTRKEMITALLKANGREYKVGLSGYGSVAFFAPGKNGVGGVYWEKNDADGRYHLTTLGVELAKNETVATTQQRKDALNKYYAQMRELREKLDAAKKPKNNPFVNNFLSNHPMVSAASAQLAEAAWDAALEMAVNNVGLHRNVISDFDAVVYDIRALKSTEQRNAPAAKRKK